MRQLWRKVCHDRAAALEMEAVKCNEDLRLYPKGSYGREWRLLHIALLDLKAEIWRAFHDVGTRMLHALF
jgi:hypothetical protein